MASSSQVSQTSGGDRCSWSHSLAEMSPLYQSRLCRARVCSSQCRSLHDEFQVLDSVAKCPLGIDIGHSHCAEAVEKGLSIQAAPSPKPTRVSRGVTSAFLRRPATKGKNSSAVHLSASIHLWPRAVLGVEHRTLHLQARAVSFLRSAQHIYPINLQNQHPSLTAQG